MTNSIRSARKGLKVLAMLAMPTLTFGATVVHDAGRDLVMNSDSRSVYTNFYGGVWSFMRSSSLDGARTLMPAVRTRLDAVSPVRKDSADKTYIMERGPAKATDSSPCFAVNPTALPDNNTFMRGSSFPPVQPGELSCHPGNTTDSGNQCVVLRFTVPRDGIYKVVVKTWNLNEGWYRAQMMVNGTVQTGPVASQGSNPSNITTNDLSLASANYKTGDVIEFALDGKGTYFGNATGFGFVVEETVDQLIDWAKAYQGEHEKPSPSNPFSDAVGTWEAAYTDGDLTKMLRKSLSAGYVRTSQGAGLKGCALNSALPWVVVNASECYVCESSSGKASWLQGRSIAPGEMLAHPDAAKSVLYRFTPSDSGIYDIGFSVRDVAFSQGATGVDVVLLQGGQVLARRTVSVEESAVVSSETVFLPNVTVVSGIPLELVIDKRNDHASDATAFRLAFVKRNDFTPKYSANAALKANMKSSSPAVDWTYAGARWTIGYLSGGYTGAFTPFTLRQNSRYDGKAEGFGRTTDTSPYICANVSDGVITTGDGNEANAGIGAIITHPAASDHSPTAIRLTVPETAVYDLTAWYKDLNAGGATDSKNGATGYVFVNGQVREQISFMSESASNDGLQTKPSACASIDQLYLRANDTVLLATDERGVPNNDLTALYAWADLSVLPSRHVNFDFDVPDAQGVVQTYVGAGRIGWSGERWESCRVADGATSMSTTGRSDEGKALKTTLTVARHAGPISATNATTAADTQAPALFADGIISIGKADLYDIVVSGLNPGMKYTFLFYSRALKDPTVKASESNVVRGLFAVGGSTDTSSRKWLAADCGDYAILDAVADAQGIVTGTFSSAEDCGNAYWCGLQIRGEEFPEQRGFLLLFR